MEIYDDQTNSVLNQVDAFRSSWISTNDKLRDANNRVESLEAELSATKNQLYKTTYQRDILNYTLNQLYSTLRADCKVIDQVRRNLSSFVRVAEENSTSESAEQNAIQNSINLITAEEINTSNSTQQFNEVNPSILNNKPTSRTNHNKPKVNFAKQLGLVTLPSHISSRKTSNLPNVSDQAPTLSQRNRNRGTAMLFDALSSANGTVTPVLTNKRKSRKLNYLASKILRRGRNAARDLNDDMCDVIVIDYDLEDENNSSSSRKTADSNKVNDFRQEDGNNGLNSNNSNFLSEEADENGSNSVKTANFNNTEDVQEVDGNNGLNPNNPIFLSSDEADHQEDDDDCSCLNELTDVFTSRADPEPEHVNDGLNLNTQVNLDSTAMSVGDGGNNSSTQDTPSSVCINLHEQDGHGFTVHKQNEENFSVSNTQNSVLVKQISDMPIPFIILSPVSELNKIAAENNVHISTQKRSCQNEDVERTRKKKKFGEVAGPRKMIDKPKRLRKSLGSSPSVSELHSEKTSSLPSSTTASKFSKSVSKKYSEPKKKKTFCCKFCDEIFDNARKVSHHLNRVHAGDEGTWTCQVCGFVTLTSRLLSTHVSRSCYRRLARENGTCVICEKENPGGMNFTAKPVLDLHILNNHPNSYPDYLRCPYGNGECIQHFTSSVAYDKHVQSIHKDEDLSLPLEKIFPGQEFWTCAICGKIFYRSAHLMQHAHQAHAGNRKVFSCGLCDFVTATTKTLQAHVNNHTLDEYGKNKNKKSKQ